MSLLTKIRQKPDNEKRIISFVTAVVLTLIIVGLWFSFGNSSEENQNDEENKLSEVSPWETIKNDFSNVFKGSEDSGGEMSSSTVPVEVVTEETSTTTFNGNPEVIEATTTATSSANINN